MLVEQKKHWTHAVWYVLAPISIVCIKIEK